MATGLEIFGLVGSISATIEIITHVVGAIGTAQNQDRDEHDLRMRFEADSVALRSLLVVHQNTKNLELDTISDEDRKLLDSTLENLNSLRSSLERRISKLHYPPAPETPSLSASIPPRPFTSRMFWTLWRRKELQKLEASLDDWIRRVMVVYSALGISQVHPGLTTGVATSNLSGYNLPNRINRKIDDYSLLAARKIDAEVLLKPIQNVEFLTKRSRRNMAKYYPDTGPKETNGEEPPPEPVVIEYTAHSYTENDLETVKYIESATYDLAKMLFRSEPDRTGILRCVGCVHNQALRSFGLMYELPPSARSAMATSDGSRAVGDTTLTWRLQSLRDLYKNHPSFSLTERVTLCCDIAKAVLYVHLLGWVHKSLRPENIVFFSSPAASMTIADSNLATTGAQESQTIKVNAASITPPSQTSLPQCYLAGFEYARSAKAMSDRRSSGDWKNNVYRHPRRQGIASNSEYNMAHDIYSLGVVCLEAGIRPVRSRMRTGPDLSPSVPMV